MTALRPMLAKSTKTVPTGDGWIAQPKYDGWRCVATVKQQGDETMVYLTTRTGKAIVSLSYIENALKILPVGTVLDGEMVDLNDGETQWNRTQSICSRYQEHRPNSEDPALTFVAFDCVRAGNDDLMHQSLRARLDVVRAAVDLVSSPYVQFADTLPSTDEYAAKLVQQGWEGVVCKNLNDPYIPNDRVVWKKFKPFEEVEAICTGTFDAEVDSHLAIDGCVGGITFRLTHEDGTVYDGQCAGKMTKVLRAELKSNPEKFVGLVVEIIHWGVTDDGALRHPNYRRFRDPADKAAPNPEPTPASTKPAATKPAKRKSRNYAAMKDEKLLRTTMELVEGGSNEAMMKGGPDFDSDLDACKKILLERGLLPAELA